MGRRIALRLPDSRLSDERAPPRTRLPIVTILLQESATRQGTEISFRTRLGGNTAPAEEVLFI